MGNKHWKKIRIALSLVIFFTLLMMFLGIGLWPLNRMEDLFLRLQLIPSILRFMALFFSASALGFLLVILLTALFGRVYCSSICPLGTLQDIVIALAGRFKGRKGRRFHFTSNRKNILRYSIMGLCILLWLGGSLFLVNLLDPFSNFGKISVSLLQPAYIWVHNQLVFTLEGMDLFWLFPLSMHFLPWNVMAVSVVIMLTVVVMASWRGRLFCNTICPAGSALGLIGNRPLYRIRFSETACTGCRRCEWVCKAECLDSRNRHVDHSRCINCFNCFASCPQGGIGYAYSLGTKAKRHTPQAQNTLQAVDSPQDGGNLPAGSSATTGQSTQAENRPQTGNSQQPARVENEKRLFLLGAAGSLLAIPFLTRSSMAQRGQGGGRGHGRRTDDEHIVPASKPGMIPIEQQYPSTPPGSISHDHFTNHCVACYLCVSACPTKVIVPSFYAFGLKGFMQPRMDFHRSFCNYDCVRCTEVCPTGAITRQSEEEKQLIQIGVVRFLVESCIVTVDGTDCGACSEHCPTKAVQMVPYRDGLFIPEIIPSLCVGCGACEFACPTEPYKAIYVHGRKVHRKARMIEDRGGPREDDTDDFPF